jgi:hypothetical protein
MGFSKIFAEQELLQSYKDCKTQTSQQESHKTKTKTDINLVLEGLSKLTNPAYRKAKQERKDNPLQFRIKKVLSTAKMSPQEKVRVRIGLSTMEELDQLMWVERMEEAHAKNAE